MGKEATATFIGHKECYGVQAEDVRREVEKLIASGVTDFLNGGMGGFDWMCARVVFDLKKSYPQIRNYLVIPYLTFNIAEPKYFDDIIYPEGFEKYHFKYYQLTGEAWNGHSLTSSWQYVGSGK